MQLENYNGFTIIKEITRSELDLDKTFDCGQAFRWKKIPDGTWCGQVNSGIVALKQQGSTIATNVNYDNKDWLVNYLNLDTDYTAEMGKIDMSADKYLSAAYEAGKGIHILRQDLYEMIITFIISQMNSMHNIRNCVDKISKKYGNRMEIGLPDDKVVVGYTFPSPEVLAGTTSEELRECSVGFRDRYIMEISEFISDIPTFMEDLKSAKYSTAMKMLKNFNGIGDKVANCICLFALHHVNAFPIDTHIKQIINKHYSGKLDVSRFGDIAGIVQQYMFYYKALCGVE